MSKIDAGPACLGGDGGMFCEEKDHDCCGKSRKAGAR